MGSDTEAEKKKTPTALAPIAKPLAGKKLCKRTLKLVRRASEAKCLKRGVKEVVKNIRRGNTDLVTVGTTKRPTCCVLVLTKPTKGEINEEVKEKLKSDYNQVVTEVAEVTSSMF